MSDNPELETLKKCSEKLVKALKGLVSNSSFVYFLENEGFIDNDDVNRILNPVTLLTQEQKAQDLVKLIKERVDQESQDYQKLMAEFKRRGKHCAPIVKILEAEYTKQKGAVGNGTEPIGSDSSARQNPSSTSTTQAETAATRPAGLLPIRLVDGYSSTEHDGPDKLTLHKAVPRGMRKPELKLNDDETKLSTIDPQESNQKGDPSAYYDMGAGKHGVALIINNKTFAAHSKRLGTERDEYNADQTFRFLGYRTLIARDLTSVEILDLFQHLDDYLKLTDTQAGSNNRVAHDSFVCCILSHGESGAVIGVDSQPVNLSKIYDASKASKTLNSKPKIFFIQACQGKGYGRVVSDGGDTDTYSCYATIDGNVALRDTVKGSWFIIEVCKILCEYSTCDTFPFDFEERLKKNLTDNKEYRFENKYAQEAARRYDLVKDVHFFYERY